MYSSFNELTLKTSLIFIFINVSISCAKFQTTKTSVNDGSTNTNTPEAESPSNFSMNGGSFQTHVLISPILDPVVLFQLNGFPGSEIPNEGNVNIKNKAEKNVLPTSEHNLQPLNCNLNKTSEPKNLETETDGENFKINNFNPISRSFPETLQRTPNFNVEEDVKMFLKDNMQGGRMNESMLLKDNRYFADYDTSKKMPCEACGNLQSDCIKLQNSCNPEMNLFQKTRRLNKLTKTSDYYVQPLKNKFQNSASNFWGGRSNDAKLRQLLQRALGTSRRNCERGISAFNVYPLIRNNSSDKLNEQTKYNTKGQNNQSYGSDGNSVNLTNENKTKLSNDFNETKIKNELDSSLTNNSYHFDRESKIKSKSNEKPDMNNLRRENLLDNQVTYGNIDSDINEENITEKNENDMSYKTTKTPKFKRSREEDYYDNDFDFVNNYDTNIKNLWNYKPNIGSIDQDHFQEINFSPVTTMFNFNKILKHNQSDIEEYNDNLRINNIKNKLNNHKTDYDLNELETTTKYQRLKKKICNTDKKKKPKCFKIRKKDEELSSSPSDNSSKENGNHKCTQSDKKETMYNYKQYNYTEEKGMKNKQNKFYNKPTGHFWMKNKEVTKKVANKQNVNNFSGRLSSKGKHNYLFTENYNSNNVTSVLRSTTNSEQYHENNRYLAIVISSLETTEKLNPEMNSFTRNKGKNKKKKKGRPGNEINNKHNSTKNKTKNFKHKKKNKTLEEHLINKRMDSIKEQPKTYQQFKREELIGYSTITVVCGTTDQSNNSFPNNLLGEVYKIQMKYNNKRDILHEPEVLSDHKYEGCKCPCPKPCKCNNVINVNVSAEHGKETPCCPEDCKCKKYVPPKIKQKLVNVLEFLKKE